MPPEAGSGPRKVGDSFGHVREDFVHRPRNERHAGGQGRSRSRSPAR